MPGMPYEEKETILASGDSTLFYSDGLVEAHNPQREMFGFPRLRELVAGHGEERSLGDFLLEELYSFVGGLGAGGRHHFSNATARSCEPLNFLELR
jgi:serine phosphatase RsbU (regulator of sigma subunit)